MEFFNGQILELTSTFLKTYELPILEGAVIKVIRIWDREEYNEKFNGTMSSSSSSVIIFKVLEGSELKQGYFGNNSAIADACKQIKNIDYDIF